MTEGQSLFLIFAVLYVIECLRWLPATTYLIAGSGTRWELRRPLRALEILRLRPALLPLFPPLQAHFQTQPWPLIPAEAGLEWHEADVPDQLLPWHELSLRVEGRVLHLSASHRLCLQSEAQAYQLHALVQRWISLPQEAREADFLQYVKRTLDTQRVASVAANLTQQTRLLRHLGGLLFLWTFGVMTVVYRWLGEGAIILWVAGALLMLQLVQALLFYRRAQQVKHRFWKALVAALLPQHAMRVGDLFQPVDQAELSHPLATRALIDEERWWALARHFWKQARYRPSSTRELQVQALSTLFEQEKVPLDELEPQPTPQPGSVAYCPLCEAQFSDAERQCQDCGGLALRRF